MDEFHPNQATSKWFKLGYLSSTISSVIVMLVNYILVLLENFVSVFMCKGILKKELSTSAVSKLFEVVLLSLIFNRRMNALIFLLDLT